MSADSSCLWDCEDCPDRDRCDRSAAGQSHHSVSATPFLHGDIATEETARRYSPPAGEAPVGRRPLGRGVASVAVPATASSDVASPVTGLEHASQAVPSGYSGPAGEPLPPVRTPSDRPSVAKPFCPNPPG
jgi:hypothetical protein